MVASLYQVVRRFPLWRTSGAAANLQLETLHMASRELRSDNESTSSGTVVLSWEPVLESAVVVTHATVSTGPAGPAGPAETVSETVLGEQAAAAGLVQDGETATGARGELVELLLWAVAAGQLPAGRARVIATEARPGAQEHAGVSAVAWRKRRSRTVRQLRAVADQWVQAA